MDFDAVLVLGPQGSGKSTQGKRLAEKLGFLFWDTGDILRQMIKGGGPLAERISVINRGMLLSDELIIEVAKMRLANIPPDRGVVFDGIPRRIGQGRFLIEFLKEQKRQKPVTIFIDVPREVSIDRLTRREDVEKRADDTPDGIAERLKLYAETMHPVLEYLKEETRFISIDGRPSTEEVEKKIAEVLGLPPA